MGCNWNVFFLDKNGEVIKKIVKDRHLDSQNIYPIVLQSYFWDKSDQKKSAQKYKDQIKRVFYPEKADTQTKNVLQDDIQRLRVIGKFNYGGRVLELGCSDGSVSIRIAQLNHVEKVIGTDIRKSAIDDGKILIKDLLKKRAINRTVANKITLKNIALEEIPKSWGLFNSICAYEIFEHMTPWRLTPAFTHLYRFIKSDGKFFISVPNRFNHKKYDALGRSRWKWYDHRNFFSKLSLELFLMNFFKKIRFYSLYDNEQVEDGIYLICECQYKKS